MTRSSSCLLLGLAAVACVAEDALTQNATDLFHETDQNATTQYHQTDQSATTAYQSGTTSFHEQDEANVLPVGCCDWSKIEYALSGSLTMMQVEDTLPCSPSAVPPMDVCDYLFPSTTPGLVAYVFDSFLIGLHHQLNCDINGEQISCPSMVNTNQTLQGFSVCFQVKPHDRAGPAICLSQLWEFVFVVSFYLSCVLVGVFALQFVIALICVVRGLRTGRTLKHVLVDATLIWPFGLVLWINWDTQVEFFILSQFVDDDDSRRTSALSDAEQGIRSGPGTGNDGEDTLLEASLPGSPDHAASTMGVEMKRGVGPSLVSTRGVSYKYASPHPQQQQQQPRQPAEASETTNSWLVKSEDWQAPHYRRACTIRESWQGVLLPIPKKHLGDIVSRSSIHDPEGDHKPDHRSVLDLQNQFNDRNALDAMERIKDGWNFKTQETIEMVFRIIFCFLNVAWWAFFSIVLTFMTGYTAFVIAGAMLAFMFLSAHIFLGKALFQYRTHIAFLTQESGWLRFISVGKIAIRGRMIVEGCFAIFACAVGVIVWPWWMFVPIVGCIFAPALLTSFGISGYVAAAHYHELRDFGAGLLELDAADFHGHDAIGDPRVMFQRIQQRAQTHASAMTRTKHLLAWKQGLDLACKLFGMNTAITFMFVVYSHYTFEQLPLAGSLGFFGFAFMADAVSDLYRYARIGNSYFDLVLIMQSLCLERFYADKLYGTYWNLVKYFSDAQIAKQHCWNLFGGPLTTDSFKAFVWSFAVILGSTVVGFLITASTPDKTNLTS